MIPFGLFSCLPLNFLVVSPVSSMRASLMFSKSFLKCPWISKRDAGPAASNTCRARPRNSTRSMWRDRAQNRSSFSNLNGANDLPPHVLLRTNKDSWSWKFCQKGRNLLAKNPLLEGIAWKRRETFLPSTFFNEHTFPESVQPAIFPREASRVLVFVSCFP